MSVETREALEWFEAAIAKVGSNLGHTLMDLDTLRAHEEPVLRGAYSAVHDLMGDLASVLIAAGVVRMLVERESGDVATTRLPLAS